MENLADHFGNYAERAVKAYNEMDTETHRDVAVLAAILFFIPILIYIISTYAPLPPFYTCIPHIVDHD